MIYKKITIISSFIFAACLIYTANKFNAVNDFKFAQAKDFVPYYEAAANQLWFVGCIIFLVSWLWVNVVAIKTKKLFWLWIPFLFAVFVALTNSYQEEYLFHFKRTNGLWKGGFSLSYFIGVAIILIVSFIMVLNKFILKKYLHKLMKK